MKIKLIILLIISTFINLTLFFIQKKREVTKLDFLNNETLLKENDIKLEVPILWQENKITTKFSYILFLDSHYYLNHIKKINQLDSLSYVFNNINFILCTANSNDSLINYFKKNHLHFKHLKFIDHKNKLHSSISNFLKLNHKVFGADAIIDYQGNLIYETYKTKKNSKENLIKKLDSLNTLCNTKFKLD